MFDRALNYQFLICLSLERWWVHSNHLLNINLKIYRFCEHKFESLMTYLSLFQSLTTKFII